MAVYPLAIILYMCAFSRSRRSVLSGIEDGSVVGLVQPGEQLTEAFRFPIAYSAVVARFESLFSGSQRTSTFRLRDNLRWGFARGFSLLAPRSACSGQSTVMRMVTRGISPHVPINQCPRLGTDTKQSIG